MRTVHLLLGIESGNHPYTLVIGITVEHLLAEGEERLRRHIIILKHNATVDNGERPFLGDVFRRVAAIVALLILAVHLTLPVDVGHHLSASFYAGHVTLATRSVLIEEEA